jgi:hypothetical protein
LILYDSYASLDNRKKYFEYVKQYHRAHYDKWTAEEIVKYEEMVTLCANSLLQLYQQQKSKTQALNSSMRLQLVNLCIEKTEREMKILEVLQKRLVYILKLLASQSKLHKLRIWQHGDCLSKTHLKYILK